MRVDKSLMEMTNNMTQDANIPTSLTTQSDRFNSAMGCFLKSQIDNNDTNENIVERMGAMLASQMGLKHELSCSYLSYCTTPENLIPRVIKFVEDRGWTLLRTMRNYAVNPLADREEEAETKDDLFDWMFEEDDRQNHYGLYFHEEREEVMVLFVHERGINPRIFADSETEAIELFPALAAEFPPNEREAAPDTHIDVNFWNLGPHGPTFNTRRLDCPDWEEISPNYNGDIRSKLDPLMAENPARAGIILWSGEPGTGKTTALRALMQEWREDCSYNVIVDPEVFLNDPSYIQTLLVQADGDESVLLILEDSGELIAADAKERVGQAISRLLNATDGLLGQGRKIMIMITTNEEQKSLHGAVTRPGRSLQALDFKTLNKEEISAWCKDKGVNVPSECDGTIAALYEHLRLTKKESKK